MNVWSVESAIAVTAPGGGVKLLGGVIICFNCCRKSKMSARDEEVPKQIKPFAARTVARPYNEEAGCVRLLAV
jgi:hypothetical protein